MYSAVLEDLNGNNVAYGRRTVGKVGKRRIPDQTMIAVYSTVAAWQLLQCSSCRIFGPEQAMS